MPEGHSVHRIARQFASNFLGDPAAVTSPQGRFAAGAALLDGREMLAAEAIGKHLFLDFDGRILHVHLGIYGAWDFAGKVSADPSFRAAGGRMGQTGMRGVDAELQEPGAPHSPAFGGFEDALTSIGAPRTTRLQRERISHGGDAQLVHMGERERSSAETTDFPPPPIGQVRVRILTPFAVADLRGPTVCAVLEPEEAAAVAARLGPDPLALTESPSDAEDRFVARLRGSGRPVGQLLMDQSVVAGIGNVYRAELLFRARIDPHRPGKLVTEREARGLWQDWTQLLRIGVETGQMLTIDGQQGAELRAALADREARHWVYKREGLPCKRCGTTIALEVMQQRKLYWCPGCQL